MTIYQYPHSAIIDGKGTLTLQKTRYCVEIPNIGTDRLDNHDIQIHGFHFYNIVDGVKNKWDATKTALKFIWSSKYV